ncbi:hypothetical protein JQC92_21555 [Shewanella sp. 202IG2-18]|uniref:hypothetical protein n=1 Tax=Parashewanella hymeniacidonis TaxID=2807618 RepID=UPI001960CC80|nr:hypothetical protein [Parashewanella hymeniacidonis]MBM7074569.1 hypothetical protein [Parashewanella hymeniacidonis]
MSLVCSNCSKTLKVTKISEQRGEGLATEIRCYHCEAWLGKSVKIAKLKMFSFYAIILFVAFGYFLPDFKVAAIILSIFSGIGLMISHFMDHLFTVERPPEEDVSEELRKYR